MKTFKILFKVGFLKLSSYIEASLVNTISILIFVVIQYYVWLSILNSNNSIEYSFLQMFSYITFSQIIACVYPGGIGKQLGNMILSGEISIALLKPISLVKQLIYENLGVSLYRFLFISIPVFIISSLISGFKLCYNNVWLFIATYILSYVIYIYIDLLFGLMQFYTTNFWGISSLKYAIITLCSGRIFPLSIYPKWSQKILDMLPFQYLYDLPLGIIINPENISGWGVIIGMIIWIMVLSIIFQLFYKVAVKKVSIMGG